MQDRTLAFLRAAVVVATGVLTPGASFAGVNTWTTGWPATAGAGAGIGVVVDPQRPGTIYAGSQTGASTNGVFKSTDNGATWLSCGLLSLTTRVLATAAPATVYVSGVDGTGIATLYGSPDGGIQWNPMGQSPSDLVVDPFSPTTLYRADNFQDVATGQFGSRISRSIDGGQSWSEIDSGMDLFRKGVAKIAADPGKPGTLYAAAINGFRISPTGFLWKTVNSGMTWTLLTSALGYVNTLAVDPTNPSIVYAGGQDSPLVPSPGGVFKSTDGGATFLESSSGLTNRAVVSICVDPHRPSRVYVSTDSGGVFASDDGGASWRAMTTGLTSSYVGALAIDSSGANLHVATSTGVFDYEFVSNPAVLSLDPGQSFGITLTATDQRTGRTGSGLAIPVNNLFGYFSLPSLTGNPNNPEVFVKMLDGTAINGFYWFFYGGLTDLEYTLAVKDEATGQTRTFTNPAGSECGGSDTAAFAR